MGGKSVLVSPFWRTYSERKNNGETFFGNFLLHATTHHGAMKMNFASSARAVPSSLFHSLAFSVPLPFLLSFSIRFKRLTFPIIRGHQFTFNSEQYFTSGVVGRLHDARMSLLALQELIVCVVFVAVVVKSFPRMYEENAVGECLPFNSWNWSLEEAITRIDERCIDPREIILKLRLKFCLNRCKLGYLHQLFETFKNIIVLYEIDSGRRRRE